MRRGIAALLIALPLAMGGCSSTPTEEGPAVTPAPVVDKAKSAEVNAELGLRYMMQGQYDVALEKLKRALEFAPRSAKANHYIAELYRRTNEPKLADRHYQRALDIAPDDLNLRNNYGVFLCGQNRFRDGEGELLRVVKEPNYPGRAQAYENLGLCAFAQYPDKAQQYFKEALRLESRLPKSLIAMAELNFNQRNFLSARAYLQRYQELAPHSAQTLWLGARIEQELGDRQAAADFGYRLKKQFPDSEETAKYLGSERR